MSAKPAPLVRRLVDERYNAAWWPRTTRAVRCLGCGKRVRDDMPCPHCQVRAINRRIAAQKGRKAA